MVMVGLGGAAWGGVGVSRRGREGLGGGGVGRSRESKEGMLGGKGKAAG